jgi:hypothetical protein
LLLIFLSLIVRALELRNRLFVLSSALSLFIKNLWSNWRLVLALLACDIDYWALHTMRDPWAHFAVTFSTETSLEITFMGTFMWYPRLILVFAFRLVLGSFHHFLEVVFLVIGLHTGSKTRIRSTIRGLNWVLSTWLTLFINHLDRPLGLITMLWNARVRLLQALNRSLILFAMSRYTITRLLLALNRLVTLMLLFLMFKIAHLFAFWHLRGPLLRVVTSSLLAWSLEWLLSTLWTQWHLWLRSILLVLLLSLLDLGLRLGIRRLALLRWCSWFFLDFKHIIILSCLWRSIPSFESQDRLSWGLEIRSNIH